MAVFGGILSRLQGLTGERRAFDPAGLGDPVALETRWTPARRGGANFRTHRLVQVDWGRVEFRPTVGSLVFSLVFLLVGSGLLALLAYDQYLSGGLSVGGGLVIASVLGLVLSLVGAAHLYGATTPIVFDKRKGCFWKGRRSPDDGPRAAGSPGFVRFEDIHALQLLAEYCGGKTSFYSHELNLVLRDGRRVNVVDHGSREHLGADAQALAQFLEKPVWDAR